MEKKTPDLLTNTVEQVKMRDEKVVAKLSSLLGI